MFGLNLWKTNNPFIDLSELVEEKDTFPLGTIKKYGKQHLYVKVGGKKPWVYYATIGTDKANAAMAAGGCVVVDGKAVGPATTELLAKHGQKHPHEGGTPPPIEMPHQGPAAAGGMVSATPLGQVPTEPEKEPEKKPKEPEGASAMPAAPPPAPPVTPEPAKPAAAPEPEKPSPAKLAAIALTQKANAISATASTPEEHDAAVKAHIAAHNAYAALGDTATAASHETAMMNHLAAKKKAKAAQDSLGAWADFPNPWAAQASIGQLVKLMDKGGADAATAVGFNHTYGSGFAKVYKLAKLVQSFAGDKQDPEGLVKHAAANPAMATKLTKDYGSGWETQAKAIGAALQSQGELHAPAETATPPPPAAAEPAPTISQLAGKMLASGASLDVLEKTVAQHPELKDKLEKLTGMNYKDAAFIAMQMVSSGAANTIAGYKDLPPDHVVHKAIQGLAAEMGMSMPAPEPAPPPPSAAGASAPSGSLKGFVQDLADIPLDVSDKQQALGQVAYKIKKAGLDAAFSGYVNPEGVKATPTEVLAVAHSIVHSGMTKAVHDYGHLVTSDGIYKLWNVLGQPVPPSGASSAPTAAPPPSPATPPPTSTPAPTSHNLTVHVPKKGLVYQAIKKLGYDVDSDEAKVVALLHTFGDYDKVQIALQTGGLTSAEAEKLLNKVVQDGPKAGAFDWDADHGYPTFHEGPKKPKKPKPAGALAAYTDELKSATLADLKDLASKIETDHPGFFANYETHDGQPVAPTVVLHAAVTILAQGLKKATAKNSIVSAASMKKLAAALKPSEDGDVASASGSTGGSSLPPPPPSPIPAGIPPMSDLKLKGDAKHLGGAGQKAIYVDKQGTEYLFKVAKSKSGSKVEPWRAEVQAAFSAIARKVKPNHPPIAVVTLGGQLGTIYPFVAAKGNLASVSPSSLTDTEKFDVASEHILDWLGSQHDSHGANLLRTDDGRVVGLDKEQGFKYFPNDKLDVDYHPNAQYGENEPYYNKFWREWSEGKFNFDPKTLSGVIEKATNIPGKEYQDILTPYAAARFPDSKIKQGIFTRQATNRKNTLRRDYEQFLSKLYEKRSGEPGTFTFSQGWVPKSKEAQPYEKTIIVTPEKHVPQETHTADTLLATLPGTSKTAPYTPKGATEPDPTKITVKTTADSSQLKAMLKKMGFGDVETKTGGHYTMAFVDKAKWDAFHETIPAHTIPAVTKKEMVYPGKTIPPHPGHATYFPEMRASQQTDGNVSFLKTIKKDTKLNWMGTRITLDGPAVEQQVARVARKKDAQGEYYEVHFKLREPVLREIEKNGTTGTYTYPMGEYDEKTDTQEDTGSSYESVSTRKFTTPHGETYVVPTSANAFAMQGSVYAKIRTGPEKIHQALTEALEKMKPGLSKEVLRDPTPQEKEVVALSAALKAVAPKVADQLDKDELSGTVRTPELLRKKLKPYMSDEDIASLGQVEILNNHAGVILPGRWRKLGGTKDPADPNVRFLMWEVSTPDKVVNMLKGNGPAGIHDRALQGVGLTGASVTSDIRTGAADNITMRMVTKSEDAKSLGQGWGDIRLIFAPDELDRLDPFFHYGDKYGCTNPNDSSYGGSFKNRHTLDTDVTSQMSGAQSGELVIRRGIPKDKIVRISCDDENDRKNVLQALRAEGITEINKVPIEDFVVCAKTRGEVYEKYVKPAGY